MLLLLVLLLLLLLLVLLLLLLLVVLLLLRPDETIREKETIRIGVTNRDISAHEYRKLK
jgi:hypothetical protein